MSRLATKLVYQGLTGPISVAGSGIDGVREGLDLLLPDWPYQLEKCQPNEDSDIAVKIGSGICAVTDRSRGVEKVHDSTWDAARRVRDVLMNKTIGQRDDQVGVHAGAVRIGSEVVLLLGEAYAGKTSIVAHLAAAGHYVIADDCLILRLEDGKDPFAIALGFALLIRLPLPDDFDPCIDEFVTSRAIVRKDEFAMVRLKSDEAAKFPEGTAVSALVDLDRAEDVAGELSPASSSDTVRSLLLRAWHPSLDTSQLMKIFAPLATGLPTYRLRYQNSRGAAEVLEEFFDKR